MFIFLPQKRLLYLVLSFSCFLLFGETPICNANKGISPKEKEKILELVTLTDSVKKQEELTKYIKNANDNLKFMILPILSVTCVINKDYSSAERYAKKMLELAKSMKDSWNYGNAVHDGNMVLGLIELNNKNLDKAKNFLILAGKAPTSPQIHVYGPNMLLADSLLDYGENDIVIEYLNQLKKVWSLNDGKLDSWIAAIKGGGKPYFGMNLLR